MSGIRDIIVTKKEDKCSLLLYKFFICFFNKLKIKKIKKIKPPTAAGP